MLFHLCPRFPPFVSCPLFNDYNGNDTMQFTLSPQCYHVFIVSMSLPSRTFPRFLFPIYAPCLIYALYPLLFLFSSILLLSSFTLLRVSPVRFTPGTFPPPSFSLSLFHSQFCFIIFFSYNPSFTFSR